MTDSDTDPKEEYTQAIDLALKHAKDFIKTLNTVIHATDTKYVTACSVSYKAAYDAAFDAFIK